MLFAVSFCLLVAGSLADMPLPFTRELEYETPTQMSGSDVTIYQNLIVRDDAVTAFESTGVYDKTTGINFYFLFLIGELLLYCRHIFLYHNY